MVFLLGTTLGLVLLTLVVLAFYAFYVSYKKYKETGSWPQADYKTMYTMGLVWVPVGVVFFVLWGNVAFLGLGLVFFAAGYANKDKWQANAARGGKVKSSRRSKASAARKSPAKKKVARRSKKR